MFVCAPKNFVCRLHSRIRTYIIRNKVPKRPRLAPHCFNASKICISCTAFRITSTPLLHFDHLNNSAEHENYLVLRPSTLPYSVHIKYVVRTYSLTHSPFILRHILIIIVCTQWALSGKQKKKFGRFGWPLSTLGARRSIVSNWQTVCGRRFPFLKNIFLLFLSSFFSHRMGGGRGGRRLGRHNKKGLRAHRFGHRHNVHDVIIISPYIYPFFFGSFPPSFWNTQNIAIKILKLERLTRSLGARHWTNRTKFSAFTNKHLSLLFVFCVVFEVKTKRSYTIE